MFCNNSKFIFNIWLMGWEQEEFGGGLQNQAEDTVTLSCPKALLQVIPESSFSKWGFNCLANAEKTWDAEKCLLHQDTCEAAVGFLRLCSPCQV